MRLLHTSDWHLGRSFHGSSLLDEQAAAIERIVGLVGERGIELVLIAGDLYDRAIPPAEAVELFDGALRRLHEAGAKVVAIAGNHDSNVRVAVYDSLLGALGVTVRGDPGRVDRPVVLDPGDGGPPVAAYALPYLDPTLAGPVLASLASDDAALLASDDAEPAGDGDPEAAPDPSRRRFRHDEVTRIATRCIRRDLARRPGVRSVVIAHTFVTGGVTCESERELTVGNVESVGIDAFAGFDYVALGHLHQSQECDGARVAYSGTPLPYSFSEQHHVKSVRVVELSPDGGASAELVPLGVGRPLRTVEGELDALLRDPRYADAEAARVRVTLTDAVLPMQAMARLRARFPHAAELHHRPAGVAAPGGGASGRAPADPVASPSELTRRFWRDQHGRDASAAEAELLASALDAAGRRADP